MKFHSRPIEVEAVQWQGDNLQEIIDLGQTDIDVSAGGVEHEWDITVHTNNGDVPLPVTHWLIRGLNDCYPCDPKTFEQRWEPV